MTRLLATFVLLVAGANYAWPFAVTREPAVAQAPQSAESKKPAKGAPSSAEQQLLEPLYASPTTHDRAGRIVAPVTINGQGPFRFVIDTGANRSVLSPELAKRLNLQINEQATVELSGVTGTTVVGTVAIDRLEAGDLKMRNLDLPVIGSALAGVDGILGVDGFEDMRLVVDFAGDSITIVRSDGKPAPRGYTVLPARFRHGRLLSVDVVVGLVPAKAVIDTGAEGTLGTELLRRAIYRKLLQQNTGGRATVEGVTADIQYGDIISAQTIRFDSIEIEGIKVAYGDFHIFKLWELREQPAVLIGMDVLGAAEQLVIDYRRREVQLKLPTPRYPWRIRRD